MAVFASREGCICVRSWDSRYQWIPSSNYLFTVSIQESGKSANTTVNRLPQDHIRRLC